MLDVNFIDLKNSLIVAWGAVATTVGTAVGVILDLIPDDTAKLVAIPGLVLTIILIKLAVKRSRNEDLLQRKVELEVEILEAKKRNISHK